METLSKYSTEDLDSAALVEYLSDPANAAELSAFQEAVEYMFNTDFQGLFIASKELASFIKNSKVDKVDFANQLAINKRNYNLANAPQKEGSALAIKDDYKEVVDSSPHELRNYMYNISATNRLFGTQDLDAFITNLFYINDANSEEASRNAHFRTFCNDKIVHMTYTYAVQKVFEKLKGTKESLTRIRAITGENLLDILNTPEFSNKYKELYKIIALKPDGSLGINTNVFFNPDNRVSLTNELKLLEQNAQSPLEYREW